MVKIKLTNVRITIILQFTLGKIGNVSDHLLVAVAFAVCPKSVTDLSVCRTMSLSNWFVLWVQHLVGVHNTCNN